MWVHGGLVVAVSMGGGGFENWDDDFVDEVECVLEEPHCSDVVMVMMMMMMMMMVMMVGIRAGEMKRRAVRLSGGLNRRRDGLDGIAAVSLGR